ncbi:MAG: hypothetical protein ACE5GN_06555, partial [Waddliaceae bacterium]
AFIPIAQARGFQRVHTVTFTLKKQPCFTLGISDSSSNCNHSIPFFSQRIMELEKNLRVFF